MENQLANHSLPLNALTALSPLDGRYHCKIAPLRGYFSEFALLRARVEIEVEWLIHLSEQSDIAEVAALSAEETNFLRQLVEQFSIHHAERIKAIEADIKHDVKAVEYFIKERFQQRDTPKALRAASEFIHFACTSEDINNLAYALLIQRARQYYMLPLMQALLKQMCSLSKRYATQPMLARTHGQPASPTTVGKEFANFTQRLVNSCASIRKQPILGKFNGASGNFNAHLAAYPQLDWQAIARAFVNKLGLRYQSLSTQIEPHDYIAELCHGLCRFNTILIDLNRDLWGYISLGYFRQRMRAQEVGSSAMPHKINPIDFENAEGNLGLSNALLQHFAATLPISRWQRDLTDSTVLRNFGVALGHSMLAVESTLNGLAKLQLHVPRLQQDLQHNWNVLAEAIQTVMRRYGIAQPYEKLKALTRGVDDAGEVGRASLHQLLETLPIPQHAKQRLLAMTPADYIGYAAHAAQTVASEHGDDCNATD